MTRRKVHEFKFLIERCLITFIALLRPKTRRVSISCRKHIYYFGKWWSERSPNCFGNSRSKTWRLLSQPLSDLSWYGKYFLFIQNQSRNPKKLANLVSPCPNENRRELESKRTWAKSRYLPLFLIKETLLASSRPSYISIKKSKSFGSQLQIWI